MFSRSSTRLPVSGPVGVDESAVDDWARCLSVTLDGPGPPLAPAVDGLNSVNDTNGPAVHTHTHSSTLGQVQHITQGSVGTGCSSALLRPRACRRITIEVCDAVRRQTHGYLPSHTAIGGGRGQWLGGTMASAEHEPITGVWGQSPQWGPGAEP